MHPLATFINSLSTLPCHLRPCNIESMDSTYISIIITVAGIIISGLISFLIASVRIGVYKNKVDTAVKDIDDGRKETKEIRDKVIACETSLKEREPLTRKKSPVILTDRGNKILIDSKGKDFVDKNYAELKKKVEEKGTQTSYDIQESSRTVINDLQNDARMNEIKDYLFKEGMEIDNIVEVLGIYLRDLILKERGIDVSDIDKYGEPKK